MPKCTNGHEQRLGLKCQTCVEPLSYRDSVAELRELPIVEPNYGKISVISVGRPGLSLKADYVGEIVAGQSDQRTWRSFQAPSYTRRQLARLSKKVPRRTETVDEADRRRQVDGQVLVVDTTKPISVLAISALPSLQHAVVIAVTADQHSTPVEQNNELRRAFARSEERPPDNRPLARPSRERCCISPKTEDSRAASDALSRLLEPLIESADDLMDLLESDLKLGIKMHSLSAIIAGSKTVYGTTTNAFMAQSYNVSIGAKQEDCQTVHSLVFSAKETEAEFQKSFGVFRNRKFKGALSAELRFHEAASPLYDIMTICGMRQTLLVAGDRSRIRGHREEHAGAQRRGSQGMTSPGGADSSAGPKLTYKLISASFRDKTYADSVLLIDEANGEMELRQWTGRKKKEQTTIARFRIEPTAEVLVDGSLLRVAELSVTLESPSRAGEMADLLRMPARQRDSAKALSDAESAVSEFMSAREEALVFLAKVRFNPREALASAARCGPLTTQGSHSKPSTRATLRA